MECKAVCKGCNAAGKASVLIETLWNVKQVVSREYLPLVLRINRNIVECKDTLPSFLLNGIEVLIETLWNVKESLCLTA